MVNYMQDLIDKLYMKILTAEPLEGSRLNSYIYATDVGKCIRQNYYRMTDTKPDEQSVNYKVPFVLGVGNAYENFITEKLILAGLYRGKVKVSSKDLGISGETDPVIEFEGYRIITEIKATHRKHFELVLNKYKQGIYPETYYDQIQTYLHLYHDADFGVLIVCNRDVNYNDNLPPFIIMKVDRDEDWRKRNWDRIRSLNKALIDNVPPDREFTIDSWQCKSCPYNSTCWFS